MSVTQLTCPACGAPATSGTCAYCGATLQMPAAPVRPVAAQAGGPGGAPGGVTVLLHGITAAHVPLLVQILGRPPERMAEVPHRHPPAVFHVQPHEVEALRQHLGARGVSVEVGGADAPQGPPGPQGPGGPRGPGFGGPRGPGGPRGFGGPGRRR